MALFKILRGNANNLPPNYHDGWAYFTTDTHEFFIDYTDNDGELQRATITSPKLIPRLSNDGVYYFEILNSTTSTILYLTCGTAEETEIDTVYYCGNADEFAYTDILQNI